MRLKGYTTRGSSQICSTRGCRYSRLLPRNTDLPVSSDHHVHASSVKSLSGFEIVFYLSWYRRNRMACKKQRKKEREREREREKPSERPTHGLHLLGVLDENLNRSFRSDKCSAYTLWESVWNYCFFL